MEQINSTANPKIKLAVSLQQKKYRDKYNLFLLEGLRNAETAANAGAKIDMCFCTPEIVQNERAQKFLASLTCPIYEVSENIFSKISDTKSPQGLMLVVQKNDCSLNDLTILPKSCLLILDRLQDPGNIGTLIRTADALGAAAIICLNGTADVFSPKVVRSAMGSLFSLPFAVKVNEVDLLPPHSTGRQKSSGIRISPAAAVLFWAMRPTAFPLNCLIIQRTKYTSQ